MTATATAEQTLLACEVAVLRALELAAKRGGVRGRANGHLCEGPPHEWYLGEAPVPLHKLDKAVDGAMLAKFRNIGQACTAANRFIVHQDVAEEFSRRVAERVQAMKIGRGTEDGVAIGPLIDDQALAKVREHVEDAKAKGAAVLAGGRARPDLGPFFYEPTVLADVPADARILHEEPFGPIAAVLPFKTFDEVVASVPAFAEQAALAGIRPGDGAQR